MLRAVRFAVTDGLYLDANLKEALRTPDLAALLATLPHERVREELNKALAVNWRATMLHLMCDAPILGETLYLSFPTLWLKCTSESR
jgi:tRNA nucleotidyltransferase/poly(A) polymerase